MKKRGDKKLIGFMVAFINILFFWQYVQWWRMVCIPYTLVLDTYVHRFSKLFAHSNLSANLSWCMWTLIHIIRNLYWIWTIQSELKKPCPILHLLMIFRYFLLLFRKSLYSLPLYNGQINLNGKSRNTT